MNTGKIHPLEERIIRLIAAGEVVTGPRSVIKELVENAIDAEAGTIIIDIANGGQEYIAVADDGQGMQADDLLVVGTRHATSKISSNEEDLENIQTLGFRGEFLASLMAVSAIQITTRYFRADEGW
ncbi:MAG TPA: ATP-binding protein, partial [Candidatus Hodarchaeales archaeon]|nr:ATP-binding protein [Candidatus Hodarchaeales archaeon]